jgi:uncharacterized protein (TIGR02996 family)
LKVVIVCETLNTKHSTLSMTGTALYKAILSDAGDDTPRLVYADWLEENGRAEEAEFIRVECRLEASAPDHPEHTDLLDRQEELRLWLKAHAPGPKLRLAGGLKVEGGCDWWKYTLRGFPRFLEFAQYDITGTKPVRALAAALPKAFAKLPTRWLSVSYFTAEQLAELLKHPAVAGLDRLTVSTMSEEPQDEMCRLIADCPHLRNLRGLTLYFPFGEAGAAALAGSAHLARLDRLRLDQSTPAVIRTLGSAGWFHGLCELNLTELQDGAFEEFCRLDPFPNLHTLELHEASFPAAAWRAFARSKAFPRLARLESQTEMTDGQVEALADAPGLRLVDLGLGVAAIGNDGAEALARAPWLDSLRRLDLAFNRLTPSGVAAIAGSRKLTALKHLELSHNTPGAAGLRAVAGNPALRGLTTLLLRESYDQSGGFTPTHFHEFLTKLDMPRLRHLDLWNCRIGPRAARLLTGEKFASLTRLNLGHCNLTDAAVSALLAAPTLQNLVELQLSCNDLTSSVEPLADPRTMPRLGSAVLEINRIVQPLAEKLRRRPGMIV